MITRQLFLLDANVFIEAARRYYAFDLVPGFWIQLQSQTTRGKICSIDRVKEELKVGKDELADWAVSDFASGFMSTKTPDVITKYKAVIKWVQDQPRWSDAAKDEFARIADGWLVAYAIAKKAVIVTHEQPSMGQARVKIPDVCRAFKIPYIDTFAMLREIGIIL